MVRKRNEKPVKRRRLPAVSIIVVNYNGGDYLKDCFESLSKINYPKDKYEVIMADNASSDSSVEYAKNNFEFVKVIEFEKNCGFGGGNNRAAKIAKGEYLAFLNNDTQVDNNWLMECVKYIVGERKTICSSSMLNYYARDKIAGSVVKMTSFGMPLATDMGVGYSPQERSAQYIFYPIGSGMLIRRDAFLSLGGFDSSYFMYGEDVSLGWKAWLWGYKVVTVPSSIYWHRVRGSLSKGSRSPMYIYLMWRNNLLNILKYADFWNLMKMLLLFSMASVGSSIFFLKKREFSLIVAIFRSYLSFTKSSHVTLGERKSIQSKRMISDAELYEKGIFLPIGNSIREAMRFMRKVGVWQSQKKDSSKRGYHGI